MERAARCGCRARAQLLRRSGQVEDVHGRKVRTEAATASYTPIYPHLKNGVVVQRLKSNTQLGRVGGSWARALELRYLIPKSNEVLAKSVAR
jgi:hypothetical protein